MPSLNGSTSHSGRDGRPLTSSKDRLCSAVTTSGPQFEIGSPGMTTDIAAYRSGFSLRLTTPLPGEGGSKSCWRELSHRVRFPNTADLSSFR